MRAEAPPLHFYRYLYDAIGRDYYWIDRKDITDEALAELIQHPDVHIHVAYVPEFQGRGLGKWLLSEAIATAWAEPTERLIVETCTLDAPKALALYQRFGFVPYAREAKVIEVQD